MSVISPGELQLVSKITSFINTFPVDTGLPAVIKAFAKIYTLDFITTTGFSALQLLVIGMERYYGFVGPFGPIPYILPLLEKQSKKETLRDSLYPIVANSAQWT
ncbi:hypothetical protein PMIN04_000590 [Paraphaeosphaeria minitans]